MALLNRIKNRFDNFIDDVFVPEQIQHRLQEAARRLEEGQYEQALKQLEQVKSDYPDFHRTEFLIGLVHFEQHDYHKALSAFENALDLRDSPFLRFYAGRAAHQSQQLDSARQHFLEALRSDSQNLPLNEILGELGSVFIDSNMPKRADFTLTQISAEARSTEILQDLASVKLALGDPDRAISLLSDLESSPTKVRLLGRAYLAKEDYQRALPYLEKSLDESPDDLEIRLQTAEAARQTGHINTAFELLQTVNFQAADEELFVDAQILLAELLEAQDQREQALELLADLIGSRQTPRIKLRLAECLNRSGETQRALDTLPSIDETENLNAAQRETFFALKGILEAKTAPSLTTGFYLFVPDRSGSNEPLKLARARLAAHLSRPQTARRILAELPPSTAKADITEELPSTSTSGHSENLRDLSLQLRAALTEHLEMPLEEQFLDIYHHLTTPLKILFAGEFNAGKSSIINALIGKDTLPVGPTPQTAHPSVIEYSRSSRLTVHTDAGEEQFELKKIDHLSEIDNEIRYLEIGVNSPLFQQIRLVDTPGFNAAEESEFDIPKLLERSDLIIWVFDATQTLSQTEISRLEEIVDADRRLLLLINKIDRLSSIQQLDELFDYLHRNLESKFLEIIGTALPGHQLHKTNRVQLDHPLMSHPALRRFFYDQLLPTKAELRQHTVERRLETYQTEREAFTSRRNDLYRKAVKDLETLSNELRNNIDPSQLAGREIERISTHTEFLVDSLKNDLDIFQPITSQTEIPAEESLSAINDLISDRLENVLGKSKKAIEQEILGAFQLFDRHLRESLALKDIPESGLVFDKVRRLARDFARHYRLLDDRIYTRFRRAATSQTSGRLSRLDAPLDALTKNLHPPLRETILTSCNEFRENLEWWLEEYLCILETFIKELKVQLEDASS